MLLEWLAETETWLGWYTLLLGFTSIGMLENWRTRRDPRASAAVRWPIHLVLAVCTNAIGVWTIGVAIVALAAARENPYGLLHRDAIPFGLQLVAGILLIDLYAYALHGAYRLVPWM